MHMIRVITTVLAVALTAGACTGAEKKSPDNETGLVADTVATLFEGDSASSDIVDVAVDAKGDIWSLSTRPPFIRRYDAAGRLRDTLGRAGTGPGELRNPWSLIATGDSLRPVSVWDFGARRIVAVGRGSVEATSVAVRDYHGLVRGDIREISFGRQITMRRLGRGFVLHVNNGPMLQTSAQWQSMLVRIDSTGAMVDTIVDFRTIGGAGQPTKVALTPIPLWTTCGDSSVVVLDPLASRMRWHDASGTILKTVALDSARRNLTEDELRAFLRHLIGREGRGHAISMAPADLDAIIARELAQGRERYGTTAPPAVAMLCDDTGRVWVETFSTADHPLGYGRSWRVHGMSESTATSVVTFPPQFIPWSLAGGRAVGVVTDSLDVQRVATVRYQR